MVFNEVNSNQNNLPQTKDHKPYLHSNSHVDDRQLDKTDTQAMVYSRGAQLMTVTENLWM